MSLVAALGAGVFAYLAVGDLVGSVPRSLRVPLHTSGRRRRARRAWLAQAGVGLSPLQFWATSAAVAAVAFAALAAATGAPAAAAVPAGVLGCLPRAFFARQRARRLHQRAEAWPDALRNLAASLSAGLSLHQGVLALAEAGPVPLRSVFARYRSACATLDQRAALEVVREELADPTSDRVIEVLILATEQGSAVVLDILADLAVATTRDLQLAERIDTAQLEQRLNARAVFVLPYLLLVALCLFDADFRSFYASGAGLVVVGIGGVASVAGMAMVARLGRELGEERVLGAAAPEPR